MKENIKQELLKRLSRQGNTTRNELVNSCNARAASVYDVVDELKRRGVIHEPERKGKKTGRKASPLFFNEKYGKFVGIHLKPGELLGTVINFSGDIIATHRYGFDNNITKEKLIEKILNFFDILKEQSGNCEAEIKAVGFADPGLIEKESLTSLLAVNIPAWRHIDIGKLLSEHAGIATIALESDTNAHTFMEYSCMSPDFPESLFHINFCYGVGGGFIKDGKLFEGATHCGMEIGHLIVEPDGPLCQCGNRGCLEAIASEKAIQREIKRLLEHGVQTVLNKNEISIENFIAAVKNNDKVALSVAANLSIKIAAALQAVVALINPEVILLSGEITRLGDRMLGIIRNYLELNCQPAAVSGVQIKTSKPNKYAASQGVALLAREKFLFGYSF